MHSKQLVGLFDLKYYFCHEKNDLTFGTDNG